MKRRTNPTARNPLPRVVSEPPQIPQDLIEAIELWGYSFLDSRQSALRSSLESQLAADGVRIVPTRRIHKGCRVHEVFYQDALAFTLSVGAAA